MDQTLTPDAVAAASAWIESEVERRGYLSQEEAVETLKRRFGDGVADASELPRVWIATVIARRLNANGKVMYHHWDDGFFPMPPTSRAYQRLRDARMLDATSVRGCSREEVSELERRVGASLPEAYRDFLGVFGHKAGSFLQGSDFNYGDLLRINAEARELVALTGAQLPETFFVFLIHQGYQFLCFSTNEAHDPQVYRFKEGDGLQPVATSFPEWLRAAVEDEIRLRGQSEV